MKGGTVLKKRYKAYQNHVSFFSCHDLFAFDFDFGHVNGNKVNLCIVLPICFSQYFLKHGILFGEALKF